MLMGEYCAAKKEYDEVSKAFVDGCDSTSYINQVSLFANLKNWNVPNKYQIKTRLIHQSYYKTPYTIW